MIKTCRHIISLFIFLCLFPEMADTAVIVELGQGDMMLQVKEMFLGDVLAEICQKYEVEISGLEHREDEVITFSARGNALEDVLKRLFRYLGEENCAFEFTDVELKRVSILPTSKDKTAFFPARVREKPAQKELANAVQVKDIIKGSQAEELNLQKDDFIVEYDGTNIHSAQQLVQQVKKTSDTEHVDMTVVRNNSPIRIVLKGGRIGVRIVTTKVPKEKLEGYGF